MDFFTFDELAEASFYFVGAALRLEDWSRAMPLIISNRRRVEEKLSDQGLMFAWMTVALARFASGRLRQARAASQKAWSVAERIKSSIGKYLAGEILGPSMIMTGRVIDGFLILDQTIDLAKKLQRTASLEYLSIQRELLRFRYAEQPKVAIEQLRKKAITVSNFISRASLWLECCRLETIAGNITAARASWREAASLLQAPAPRRIISALRTRLAMLALAVGDAHEALAIALTVKQTLHARIDLIAHIELLDLIVMAHRSLQTLDKFPELEMELKRLQATTGYFIPQQPVDVTTFTTSANELNHRQRRLLTELSREAYIDIRTYVSEYAVSEVTAFRDLSTLVHKGYLARTGRARATRYTRST